MTLAQESLAQRLRSTQPAPPRVAAVAGLIAGLAAGLLAVLPGNPLLAPLVLLALALGLAILARPDLAAPVAIGAVYSNAAVIAAQFHGAPYALAAAVPMLLLWPVAHRIVLRREPLVGMPLIALLVAYLGVMALSAVTSHNVELAMAEVNRFVTEGLVLYILIVQAIREPRLLWATIGVLLLIGGVLGALSLVQQLTGTWEWNYLGFSQAEGTGFLIEGGRDPVVQYRVAGPIGEKNRYAQVMLALVPLAIVALRRARPLAIRPVILVLLALILAGIALTFSRGAAVGGVALLAGLVALGIVGRRGVLLALAAVAAIGLAIPAWIARLATLEGLASAADASDRVISQRLNDVLAAFLVFAEHPILGVGPDLFSTVYRQYATRVPGLPGDRDYEAHILFGDIAAETGILGVVTFFGLMALTIVLLVRARRAAIAVGRGDLSDLASAFLLVIVVYLSTGLFLHLSYQRFYWLAMALAAAAALAVAREAKRVAEEQAVEKRAGETRAADGRTGMLQAAAPASSAARAGWPGRPGDARR
jgi:putative inorganic carbon (hco3(-)) transporter